MPSVLLDRFLDRSARRTLLGQPNPETQTGQTFPEILTWKPESDGQQLPQTDLTLSETKSNLIECYKISYSVIELI